MKEYKCVKDCYIDDVQIAKLGDIVRVLPDNRTAVNITLTTLKGKQKVFTNINHILDDIKYFENITFKDKVTQESKVNHPAHYTWLKEKCGVEVIDITRHMDFCLGNAIKYLLRAGHKSEEGYSDKQKEVEDLEKAIWYIKDKIKQLKNE